MPKLRDKFIPPTESPRAAGGWFYYVSPQWSEIVEGLISPLYQNYRWQWNNPEAAEQAKLWSLEIDRFRLSDLQEPCPPTNPVSCNCPEVPPEIEIVDGGKTLNIYLECDSDMTVNIYQAGCGCGCGCGSSGNSSGGGFGGGMLPGSDQSLITTPDLATGGFPDGVTQCDFITTTLPAVLDSIREFVVTIDDFTEITEDTLEAVEQAVSDLPFIGSIGGGLAETVQLIISAGSGALISMLNDNDFRYGVYKAWAKAHGTDGIIDQVTRNDFFETTKYLPNIFVSGTVVVLPKLMFPIFWRIIDINKINSRLVVARGTANDGLCEYVFAEAGQVYTPSTVGSIPPEPTYNFDWKATFDFTRPGGQYSNMELANLPDTRESEFDVGQGYTNFSASGKNTFGGFQFKEPLYVSAMRVTVTAPMDNTYNGILLIDETPEVIVYEETGITPSLTYTVVLDAPTLFDKFRLMMRESTTTTIDYDHHITDLVLWGTFTPPSVYGTLE